jgi:hypothetical protein
MVLKYCTAVFLSIFSVLRGILADGYVTFGHFGEIPVPVYNEIFAFSNYKPIMAGAHLALMVILES